MTLIISLRLNMIVFPIYQFLHQCHTSPVSVALTSENSNIAALTMKTPEDDEDVCRV